MLIKNSYYLTGGLKIQDKEALKLKLYEVLKKQSIEKTRLYEDLALAVNEYIGTKPEITDISDIKNKIELFLISKRIDGLSDRTLENDLQQPVHHHFRYWKL